jgi:putative DNA primase/helicase
MWRRVRLIPFDVVIPDAQQDHQLYDKLHAERPGILRWAVEGCLAWQQEGLAAPEKLRAATSAYREEMDSLGKFFSKHCVFEADAAIAAGALYAEYEHWATGDDESLMSKTAFGLQLKERGLTNGKIKGERSWIGIRLRRPEDEPVDGLVEQDAFEGHFGEITHTRAHSESFSETGSNASNVSSAVPSGPCPGTLEPWATWNLE